MSRRDLFPPIEPYATGRLAVDGRHSLYWEESGNPQGLPVLFLHGGPGAGATPTHRRFFDPASYRIIIFDQRGAGRSAPLGELADNNTAQLVRDIEVLRLYFAIERWVVFGGSWGSTLALSYAIAHPSRCRALVLRGIFLCRQSEIDWFLYGIRQVFPEAWRALRRIISVTRSSRRKTISSARSIVSGRFRRPSCRAATTWSARSSRRTSWRVPGRRPLMPWCPMPGTRRWSPASARSSSRRPSGRSGSADRRAARAFALPERAGSVRCCD